MKTNHTNINGKFIIALSRTLQTAHRKSELMFRSHNLTMAQFTALEALYNKGDMTVGALIETVLSTSGNMTVVIRNLEQRGLVQRLENPKDRRSFLVCLTEEGRTLIAEVFVKHMELVEESLGVLTSEEKQTVTQILKKLQ